MNRPSVIYLLNDTFGQDQYGVWSKTQTMRKVYADVNSVRASEFFEGGRNGLKPEFEMRVHTSEYKGEEVLAYDGQLYAIYRTYMNGDITELYVEKKKGEENGKYQDQQ